MSKKTIVFFLVCMLVIPNIIVSAEQIKVNKSSTEYADDVPLWSEGDSWTFSVTNFWLNYTYEGKNILMSGIIDDFKWIVTDNGSSTYTVGITGTIIATYDLHVPVGDSVLNIKGTFEPPLNKIKGTVIFDKANLHIVDFDAQLTCLSYIKINKLPIKIPLLVRITADASLSTPFPLFDFPLHVLKFWNMPEIDIVTDINIGGILGVFNIPLVVYSHYDWTPLAFCCLYQTSIDVEAGTFDAWRILSLVGGYFDYYYAPSVENIVKFEFNLPHGGIEGELKSYELCTLNSKEKSSV